MYHLTTEIEAKRLLDSIDERTIIIPKLYKEKDRKFVRQYKITNADIMDIIKNLSYKKVRKKFKCEDKRLNTEYLFDFKSIYHSTDIFGIDEIVPIYIKIGKDIDNQDIIVVVSLHEDE